MLNTFYICLKVNMSYLFSNKVRKLKCKLLKHCTIAISDQISDGII